MAVMADKARIAPELADRAVPIDSLILHPDNSRKHNMKRITGSLVRHGQRALIVVQASTRFVVKGNGTLKGAKALGWSTVAASVQDMNDDEAIAFLMDDNRASDGATYDLQRLNAGLQKMVAGPGATADLWTAPELEALAATVELDEPITGPKKERAPVLRLSYEKADHAKFVARVRALGKTLGTHSVMATINEAVKRQAEAEETGVLTVGQAPASDALVEERRATLRGLIAAITTMGVDRQYSGKVVIAQIEQALSELPDSAPVRAAKAKAALPTQEMFTPEQVNAKPAPTKAPAKAGAKPPVVSPLRTPAEYAAKATPAERAAFEAAFPKREALPLPTEDAPLPADPDVDPDGSFWKPI